MATEYAGLTVVFGADASKYNRAMKDMRSAASTVQRQLNQVQSALDLDPGNIEKTSTVVKKLKEQSATLSAQLQVVKDRIKEISEARFAEGFTAGGEAYETVAGLADATKDAALACKTANIRYNELDAALESAYKAADELIAEDEKLNGTISSADVRDGTKSFKSYVEALKSVSDGGEKAAEELETLHGSWQGALDEKYAYGAVQQLESLRAQAAQLDSKITSTATHMSGLQASQASDDLESARASASKLDSLMDGVRSDFSNATGDSREFRQAVADTRSYAKLLKKDLDALSGTGFAKMANTTSDISGEVEKLRLEWEDVSIEVAAARAKITLLVQQQKKVGDGIDGAAGDYEELGAQIEAANAELRQLEDRAEAARAELDVAAEAKSYKELRDKVSAVEAELDDMSDDADTNIHKMGEGIKDVGQAFEEISQVAQNVLGEIVDATYDVSDAYADMRKTVEGTEQDFEDLYTAAMEYSTTSVTSASEILSIEAVGGQLGLAVDELEEFATVVSNLSIATDLDADTAATDIGQLANILDDLTTDTMSAFGDALVRLGNNTATTESTILDIATRIGSEGSVIGFTSSELLALSATVAEAGVNAESGGTAIVNTMSDIETAVSAGGDDLKAFADVAGVSSEEFAETWETKPIEAIQLFVQGLADIDENGGSVDSTLESLGITGVRQKTTIEALVQTIDNLDDNLSMSEDAWAGLSDEWGSAGDAANEAEKKSEGFAGQLTILQNSASNLAAELGDTLTPYISMAADVVGDLTTEVSGMSDSTKTMTLGMIGVAAAIGPVLTNVGSLVSGYGNMIIASKKSQKQIAKAAKVVKSSNTAFAKLATTMNLSNSKTVALSGALSTLKGGLVAVAAAAATYIAVKIATHVAEQKEYTEECAAAWQSLDEIMDEAYESVYGLDDAIDDSSETLEQVKDDVHDYTESVADLKEAYSDAYTELYTETSALDSAMEVIEEYGGQTDLSATKVTELQQALDVVNEKLGKNYQLHEDTAGAIYDENDKRVDNIESIRDEIEAYKDEAEVSAIESLYEDAREAVESGEAALAAAQKSGDADAIEEAERSLESSEDLLRRYSVRMTAISAGLSDATSDAALAVSGSYQEAFIDIEAAFKETMGDDFTEEFEEQLTDMLTEAFSTGNTEEVLELAHELGVDIDDELIDALSEGGNFDVTSMGVYADMVTGADDAIQGVKSAFEEALGDDYTTDIGDQIVDAVYQSIEDGDWDAVEELAKEYSVDVSDVVGTSVEDALDTSNAELALSTQEGLDDVWAIISASMDAGELTMREGRSNLVLAMQGAGDEMLAGMALTSADEDVISLSSDYLGVLSSVVDTLNEAVEEGDISLNDAKDLLLSTADPGGEGDVDYDELLQSYANLGIAIPSELVEAISSGVETVDGTTAMMLAAAALTSDDPDVQEAFGKTFGVGLEIIQNLADGIEDTDDLAAALDTLYGYMQEEMTEGTDDAWYSTQLVTNEKGELVQEEFQHVGDESISKYCSSIIDGADIAEAETQGFVEGLIAVLQDADNLGEMFTSGYDYAINFANGLTCEEALTAARNAATTYANTYAEIMCFSVPEKGPFSGAEKGGERSGRHLAENFAAGIASGKDAAVEAAEELAYAVQDAMEDATFELAYSVEVASVEAVESAVADAGWNVASFSASSAFDDVIAALGRIDGSVSDAVGTTINQTFETKVVRSDADLYTAAPIIYRNAMREASLIS